MTVVLDSNAVIMHGRAFPDRVRRAASDGRTICLPRSVVQELVDDVLANESAPSNHRESARSIERLLDEDVVIARSPDFERYSEMIDESRRRIADDSRAEHEVQADQYIPALVCELAHEASVQRVTGDRKLGRLVQDLAQRDGVQERVTVCEPLSVL